MRKLKHKKGNRKLQPYMRKTFKESWYDNQFSQNITVLFLLYYSYKSFKVKKVSEPQLHSNVNCMDIFI